MPTLLYSLLTMGLGDDPRVQQAVDHLAGLVDDDGWRCVCAPESGKFRGPGRKDDPCLIAIVYALKALPCVPELSDGTAVQQGIDMLLWQWEHQNERKLYLFGIGTDFRKLKYPFVWYNILHEVDVLSRFPFIHDDPRFQAMLARSMTRRMGTAVTRQPPCIAPGKGGRLQIRNGRRPG